MIYSRFLSNRPDISLRISLTDRCQLRCFYCMPSEGIAKIKHEQILTFEEIIRFLKMAMTAFEIRKIHLTGGEPLVRTGVVNLVENISSLGIADVAMTTNGQYLAELAPQLRRAGLTRVNISCDSLNERTFRDITRSGRLSDTLDGIKAACRWFKSVKLNTVVLKGLNDGEVVDISSYGMERGCEVRFIELMPIHCARLFFDKMFVPASETYARLAERFTLEPLPYQPGESSRKFAAVDGRGQSGVIGFICSLSKPFCGDCRRIRLTSDGRLISCLARGHGIQIRKYLQHASDQSTMKLNEIIQNELINKRVRESYETVEPMTVVGG